MSFVVVLDACVLFPGSLRDILLRAAGAGMYKLGLTTEILEEVRRNLFKKEVAPENARRLMAEIRKYFNDSFIYGYESLFPPCLSTRKIGMC